MIAVASSASKETVPSEGLPECSRLIGICVGMDISAPSSWANADTRPLFAGLIPPQLGPIIQPLSDFALKTALGRIVERLPPQRFREIVLAGKAVRRVVVVCVAGAVAFLA